MYEDSLILKYEQTLIQTNYLIKNNIQLYIFLRIAHSCHYDRRNKCSVFEYLRTKHQ